MSQISSNRNYIVVLTLDGIKVEVTYADAGRAPDAKGGQNLNTSAVWVKPEGGEWMVTDQRSAIKVCEIVKHCNLNELGDKLDGNRTKAICSEQGT